MITARVIEGLYARLQRARELVEAGKVYPVAGLDGVYTVLNSDGSSTYLVHAGSSCTCPDFERWGERGLPCKHLLAVELYLQNAQRATETPEPNPPPRNGRTRARSRPATTEPLQDPPIPTPEQLAGSLHDPD